MKSSHTKDLFASMLLLSSATVALAEPNDTNTNSGTPNLGGGRIYRTEARPVNTGSYKMGVQIEGGRVFLTDNGGRWVENSVHVANIAQIGKEGTSASALTTIVPHRFPGQPPKNLMSVSGNDWAARAASLDGPIKTVSPPAELTPKEYPIQTTAPVKKAAPSKRTSAAAKPKGTKPNFLDAVLQTLFGWA